MQKIFISIYNFFKKKRIAFFVIFILSFLVVTYFALQVKFEEDISKILPKNKKIEKLNQIFQNSKFTDKLAVMVSLKNNASEPDSLVAYADELVSTANEKLNLYISKINARVNDSVMMELFNIVANHLPAYLSDKDYQSIDSLIRPEKIKETLNQNLKTLTSPAGIVLKKIISNDPLGITFLGLKKMQQLQYDENFELYDGYIVTKDYKHLMLFITPKYPPGNTGKNASLLKGLDSIISSLNNNNVTASYFGAAAVSVDNALQLRKDSLITQGIAVCCIIIFLTIYFRKKRAPVVILIPVLFGALFALTIIYFIKAQISVIALGAGSIVLGIAVNYSLHVFNHYRHTQSIEQLIKDLSTPLTVGSFTTIGSFFCLMFVKSEMLKDLGFFAAFSLIGASLGSLIFLPHFIVSKKEHLQPALKKIFWHDRFASRSPEYNKYIIAAIILLTITFGYWARNVGFEADLSHMNFMSDKLKQSEKQLNEINQYSLQSVYVVVEGKTLNEALMRNEKLAAKVEDLQNQNIVKKYSGVSSLMLSDSLQKIRIKKWRQYWTPEKKKNLLATLYKEGATLKFHASAFDHFKQLINKEFKIADESTIKGIRQNFLSDYISEGAGNVSVVTLVKTSPADKPLVYKKWEDTPHITVIDKQYIASRFAEIINKDFTNIALMASALVFIVLLLMYGRIELTLISFIPMMISWIWILGIMGILNIQFNIINIILSTLIFGLGDDYSLFIMNGLLQEYKTGKKNLASFKSSILLSAITTITGLGVLIFAKHPALRSIALISITGIVCVVIMSQIFIPFLFNGLIKNRVNKKFFPWTLTALIKSAFAFTYFIGWSIILTVIAWIFSLCKRNEKVKLIYHIIISKMCKSLIYIMANVKKKIINPQQENFSKPAIIISNHQSALDILLLVMLHPKLVMFTNRRIWNSFLFGKIIRMADYFTAEKIESNIDSIQERIKRGYSVIIFPEGTRSTDGTIKRFHKGAFYLAEKLQVDILPIIIHGTHDTLTKHDILLKDGQVTLKFLPRIKPNDESFGKGYVERTKRICWYFREQFNMLREEIELPSYFREKLMYNYLYKGPVLEWYMKIKIRLEKNYELFNKLIPRQGKVLDIGCGYGFMSYMLSFTSAQREITGVDYDEDKIETANHCFSKTSGINVCFWG